MTVDTKLKQLIINTLSPEQLPQNPSEEEIYLVEDDVEYASIDELNQGLETKQDIISDLETIRSNAQDGKDIIPQVNVNTQRIEDLTTAKFPNVVIIGTPHIEGGQVSNYSDTSYLQFPFVDISRGLPFDIYFSFTTAQDITTQQNILDAYFGIALAIQNGKGIMALSSNGTSWDIGTSVGTNTLLPNTTYYVKYSWTGTEYSAALSTDDQTYVPDMNLSSTLSPHKTTIFIGGSPNIFGAGSAHPFKGTINFNKSKVVVNGITVWEGMADVGLASRANVSLNNLDEVGEERFNAKQDVITDLATIRDGASKGATALQSFTETDPTVPSYVKSITQANITSWNNKQDTLVSGTNIKTIGGESLLGSGDITVSADTSNCVHKTGEEYIAGIKHFTDTILVEDTNKFLGSGIANNGSIVLQSSKTDGGFIQFLVQNYPDEESKLYNNGHLCIDKAPNETTTTSTQIDTVGARNTKIDSIRTNCITEIPQDIKLELNNGTLTLKAGSKVYVPNGDGVFNAVTINSDLTITSTTATRTTGVLFYRTTSNSLYFDTTNGISSGSSASPTKTTWMWYDTTNNKIKRSENTGSTWFDGFSFPLCIFTRDGGKISSIDQVFNGFGYIGSTVFALPGVKGLIPNGRNADGSLKNIEFTTSSVLTYTNPSNVSYSGSFIITNDLSLQASDQTYWKYNQQENLFKHELSFYSICEFSFFECNLGRITSFTPKTTFHALDYNDKSTISGWGMPSKRYIDLTLGASGSTYTAPANGWYVFNKSSTGSNQRLAILSGGCIVSVFSSASSQPLALMVPCTKGDTIETRYTVAGTTNEFRFYYANGEN